MDISIPRARRFMRRSLRGSLVLARDLLDRRISRLESVEGRLMETAAATKQTHSGLATPLPGQPTVSEEDRPAGVQ